MGPIAEFILLKSVKRGVKTWSMNPLNRDRRSHSNKKHDKNLRANKIILGNKKQQNRGYKVKVHNINVQSQQLEQKHPHKKGKILSNGMHQ